MALTDLRPPPLYHQHAHEPPVAAIRFRAAPALSTGFILMAPKDNPGPATTFFKSGFDPGILLTPAIKAQDIITRVRQAMC